MKANTTDLIKFKKLQRKLNESVRGIVGLLEMLWQATSKNCPCGDIGKFSNEDIAIMVDWEGDHDALIEALVACKWLDECDENRLVVHDWEEHCPTYIRGNLARSRRDFAEPTKYGTKEATKYGTKEGTKVADLSQVVDIGTTKPSQAYIPSQANSERESAGGNPFLETRSTMFLDAWNRWKIHSREKGKTINAMSEQTQLQSLFGAYPLEAEAINAIDFSITNNWANIDLKNSHARKDTGPPATGPKRSKKDEVDAILERTFGNAG
jgi:hypothetical protein